MQGNQKIVDNLILTKKLGKGSYGQVYLTKIKDRPGLYATKEMDRANLERPENINRFLYEVELLKIMKHPNIVKLYSLKKTKNHYYLITEFCNGGSLLDNLKKYMSTYHRPFTEEIVQYLMKQIVSAIKYLHFNKIIHRDLKLDNILVNYPSDYDKNALNIMNCQVKIIDFGFATKLNKPLTYTALGTPNNMDPKILENIKTGIPNQGYNEKVDIWSLGTLCYQMLVGYAPFSGKSMEELFLKVKKGTYTLPVTLSKEVITFINGMLQQDANKRMTAEQLYYHDFLVKHPSQFKRINVKEIQGNLGPGGVINMKSKSNSQPQVNNDMAQLWGIFNQTGIIMPGIQQVNQIQPKMQLPTQQVIYTTPQQQYFINQTGW